jgi:type II secretory pathway component PulF
MTSPPTDALPTQPPDPDPTPPASFAYEAQTLEGEPLSGTIDAPDADAAAQLLRGLRVRVLRLEPTARRPRAAALRGEDFAAFNQQLAQLTAAGLPIEHGLRLIAQDMRSGRLATTVRDVAAELERGTPLPEAFARHRGRFPALYARLVDAGIRTGNLPGMLLSLGRHLDLVTRLRGMIWRAAAYPLMVLAGLAVVIVFLSIAVIPQFREVFKSFGTRLPAVTVFILSTPDWLPHLVIGAAVVVLAIVVLVYALRWVGWDQPVIDRVVVPLPLVGPVLRRNLIARWCDALKVGVDAGLDLPAAITLAGDAVGSPTLRRDGQVLVDAMRRGQPLDALDRPPARLPATVVATIELASTHHDLPHTLETLSRMYQQQAEMRLNILPAILTPVLIVLIASIVGLVVVGLFAPFITLIQAVSGS